jgi:RHS repeat-associated protein
MKKTVNSVETRYVYDRDDIVADLNGTDNSVKTLYLTPALDENLFMLVSDGQGGWTRYWYFHDGLGSVRQVLNDNGVIKAAYDYQAFGEPYNPVESFPSGTTNRYTYTGREHDSESLSYYYRARQYYSVLGRFGARDTLGRGLFNLYLYVRSMPTMRRDPSGFNGQETEIIKWSETAWSWLRSISRDIDCKDVGKDQCKGKTKRVLVPKEVEVEVEPGKFEKKVKFVLKERDCTKDECCYECTCKLKGKYETVFVPSKSWVTTAGKGSQSLLEHEIGHFDIGEIYAKKLTAEVTKLSATDISCIKETAANRACEKVEAEETKLHEKYSKDVLDYQKQYEEGTTHGSNLDKQKEWTDKTNRDLGLQ